MIDHILFIGFGGPTAPNEIEPFLQEVTRGIPIPPERLAEVKHHYDAIGGRSPYNEYTFCLVKKVEAALREKGIMLPAFIGMRNWNPFFKDTIAEIRRQGLRRGIGIILAPHRSEASYDRYLKNVEEAKFVVGAEGLSYDYLGAWHDDPDFIAAQAAQVRKVLESLKVTAQGCRPERSEGSKVEILQSPAIGGIPQDDGSGKEGKTFLLFTAHSIPVQMAERCRYVEELKSTCSLVIQSLGGDPFWGLAYQSRSGNPRQPWLGPDVLSAAQAIAAQGFRNLLAIPVGFLCDHVEVLYDLDLELRGETEKLGMTYLRASTVMDHPNFVNLLIRRIAERL